MTVFNQNISKRPQLRNVRAFLVITTGITWLVLSIPFILGARAFTNGQPLLLIANGVIGGIIVWYCFPRLDIPPPDQLCLNKDIFPAIYKMVQNIADRHDVAMPKIVITHQYTLGFGRFGWRHTPVLFLGHGVLSVANRYETMLLLAHELHHVHVSAWAKSRIVKITMQGLGRLTPSFSHTVPIFRIQNLPWLPPLLLFWTLKMLSAKELRILEVAADSFAIRYGNHSTMETLLQKCAFRYIPSVQRAYISAAPQLKYAALRQAAGQIDEMRFALLWEAILQPEHGPLDAHPTVSERLALARENTVFCEKLPLSEAEFHLVHIELARWPIWLCELERDLMVEAVFCPV